MKTKETFRRINSVLVGNHPIPAWSIGDKIVLYGSFYILGLVLFFGDETKVMPLFLIGCVISFCSGLFLLLEIWVAFLQYKHPDISGWFNKKDESL